MIATKGKRKLTVDQQLILARLNKTEDLLSALTTQLWDSVSPTPEEIDKARRWLKSRCGDEDPRDIDVLRTLLIDRQTG